MNLSKILSNKIEVKFELDFQVSKEKLFDFIILPENMPLYTGFFLAPGIANVHSTTLIRQTGTIDNILNTDGSTHQSLTKIFLKNEKYYLDIFNIQTKGFKKVFDIFLKSFNEKWDFYFLSSNTCRVKRVLEIHFHFPLIFILPTVFFVKWIFTKALEHHHKNIIKALS